MLSPKEVVKKWVDAFNAGDVDMIVSLYDNNATNHQVANEPVVGVAAIREMFANEFATAILFLQPSLVKQLINVCTLSYTLIFFSLFFYREIMLL